MLEITTEVGLETSTNVGFCLDFLTKDIAITRVSSYEPNLSQTASRDLKHPSSLIVSYDAYYNKVLYQGTNYFDYFNFSSVMSLGQGFTYCDDAVHLS